MALFDTGASRSLKSVDLFYKLGLQKNNNIKCTKDVAVNLVDINDRPLQTLGTVTVPFSFDGELLEHEFIVAVGITDHLLIGWDAFTKFGFLAGGIGGQIFRDTKTALKTDGSLPNDQNMPYTITSKRIILKANHQMVCQSERIGGKLTPSIACFLSPSPSLPVGLRLHAFVSERHL